LNDFHPRWEAIVQKEGRRTLLLGRPASPADPLSSVIVSLLCLSGLDNLARRRARRQRPRTHDTQRRTGVAPASILGSTSRGITRVWRSFRS